MRLVLSLLLLTLVSCGTRQSGNDCINEYTLEEALRVLREDTELPSAEERARLNLAYLPTHVMRACPPNTKILNTRLNTKDFQTFVVGVGTDKININGTCIPFLVSQLVSPMGDPGRAIVYSVYHNKKTGDTAVLCGIMNVRLSDNSIHHLDYEMPAEAKLTYANTSNIKFEIQVNPGNPN